MSSRIKRNTNFSATGCPRPKMKGWESNYLIGDPPPPHLRTGTTQVPKPLCYSQATAFLNLSHSHSANAQCLHMAQWAGNQYRAPARPSCNPTPGFTQQLCVSRDDILQEPLRPATSGLFPRPINNQNCRKCSSLFSEFNPKYLNWWWRNTAFHVLSTAYRTQPEDAVTTQMLLEKWYSWGNSGRRH